MKGKDMFKGTDGTTIIKNQLKAMKRLIEEYEQVKAKKHPHFRFASDLFKKRGIKRQNFYKYYRRYSLIQEERALLPCKRGPKNPHRHLPALINAIKELRQKGLSRFEIYANLSPILKEACPSASSIYNILRKEGLNRLRPQQKRCKRMIIKEKAGELGHFDCYHLPKGIIRGSTEKLYLVGGMQIMRLLQDRYGVKFTTVMTDNGSEFKGKDVLKHPFERLLYMLNIKHIYTKPYQPQPNGKIERFWRTLYDDLLEEAEFENVDKLKDELQQYLLYYNEFRPHQSLDNLTPQKFAHACLRNS